MTIRTVLIALPLLALGWLGVLLTVMLVSDAAPAAVVLFPPQDFLDRLPAGTAILAATPASVTLAGNAPDFAKALYRQGARLVLPAGLPGCLPLSAEARARLERR